MLAVNVRRIVVYVATGIFFFVAAAAQVQGDTIIGGFTKAGIACVIVTCLGRMVVHIVDAGEKRAEDRRRGAP